MTRTPTARLGVLLGLAALLAATPASAQEKEASVPAAVEYFEGHGPDVFLLPAVRRDETELAEPVEPNLLDDLGAVLGRLVEGELGMRGGALESDGDRLVAVGPDDAVTFAVERIGAITRFVEGRCVIGVAVASLNDVAVPPPDAAALRTLVRGGGARLLWSVQVPTRRGLPARRDVLTSRRFVSDLIEDISQGASVAAPETAELVTGLRVSLLCRPLTQDRAAVTLSLHVSQAPERLRSASVSSGTLDLPAVPFVSALVPLVLDRGASEVIVLPDPTGGAGLAVAVTLSEMPAAAELPFDLVDLSATGGFPEVIDELTQPGLLREDEERPALWETGHDYEPDEDLDERVAGLGVRFEELTPGVGALVGTEEARAKARSLYDAAIATRPLRRTTRKLGWHDLTVAPWFDPLSGSVSPAALDAVGSTGTLRLPLRRGTHTVVLAGSWRRFLASINVATAQSAAVTTPAIRELFEGEVLILRLAGGGTAQVRRRGVRLLDLGTRSVAVVRDVEGRRTTAAEDQVDAVEMSDSGLDAELALARLVDIRREADDAVIEVYELD